jgi:putative transposase
VRVHPFIEAEKAAGHGVQRACRLLEVSRAAYYQRRSGVPSPRAAADAAITTRITSIHRESDGTYGSPRVHQVLRRDGASCGKRRVARLMRAAGLEGRRKKRWRTTTIPDPAAERARDLIQRDFAPSPGTDRRYVGDITYVATWQGWAYLATVIDLSSRRVAGWALADHMRTELVENALSMAFAQRRPAEGAIFHSDRGCQGGFNRSSQHLDHGGSRWDAVGSSCRSRRRVPGGSGPRIGRCVHRCVRLAGLSPHVRCSGSSGG